MFLLEGTCEESEGRRRGDGGGRGGNRKVLTFNNSNMYAISYFLGASKLLYLILVAMVSFQDCCGTAECEYECSAPRTHLHIKEMFIVVMMVTGTLFEIGEVTK